jgi:hypothetical protein
MRDAARPMDPQVIGADQWLTIARLLDFLFLFTGLALTSALAFLLAHAIVPSLRASRDGSIVLEPVRWLAYPVALGAAALAMYTLARTIALAADVMQRVYPRFWL